MARIEVVKKTNLCKCSNDIVNKQFYMYGFPFGNCGAYKTFPGARHRAPGNVCFICLGFHPWPFAFNLSHCCFNSLVGFACQFLLILIWMAFFIGVSLMMTR